MASIGLMFYRARWYDPALGRFAQADTIIPGAGNPLAWDRYAYVNDNPVRFTDPSGHIPCNHPRMKGIENCYSRDPTKFLDIIIINGLWRKAVYLGKWPVTNYIYAKESDAGKADERLSYNDKYIKVPLNDPKTGEVVEVLNLPFRFVYGTEGIAMQGTGILKDGRPVFGWPFRGKWVEKPGIGKDYFSGDTKLYLGWGQPSFEMTPFKFAAVGPSYKGSTLYVPYLAENNITDGVVYGWDRGGEIQDGDMDLFVGEGLYTNYLAKTLYGLNNPTTLDVYLLVDED